ncbi:MAG: endonuclease III domain-containing protein [Planctomycetes bacterium]|nr:endonuclease III domain-containing protein [Planctomycetota bacterium]
MPKELLQIYTKLLKHFGPQKWWPGETSFEVIIGAILTQNTNWSNVEKAINNLKAEKVLTPECLHKIKTERLAGLIKPAGYFNIKAKRLKSFINWLFENYGGDLDRLFAMDTGTLREALLQVCGIGPETADSIVLYAAGKPSFVVDAYTYRVFSRHKFIPEETDYDEVKAFFEDNLSQDVKLFNEYHALLVRLGKTYCKKTRPLCEQCPLNGVNDYPLVK